MKLIWIIVALITSSLLVQQSVLAEQEMNSKSKGTDCAPSQTTLKRGKFETVSNELVFKFQDGGFAYIRKGEKLTPLSVLEKKKYLNKYKAELVSVRGILKDLPAEERKNQNFKCFSTTDLGVFKLVTLLKVIKEIPKGQTVKRESIETCKMESYPVNLKKIAICSPKLAIGRKAKYLIEKGQFLSKSDLLPLHESE